ncbi:hypothetical protein [Coleofasciculus sp. F4-SAH-05]|uniref:hypothetical protein n=1 Tax=Coleofasciculus sp. F4-SAH-05 TaxID=3069525 RepID=UPI0032F34F31
MAQFPLQDAHQITHPLVQDTYAEISAELGFGMIPNLFKSMAIRPELPQSMKFLIPLTAP